MAKITLTRINPDDKHIIDVEVQNGVATITCMLWNDTPPDNLNPDFFQEYEVTVKCVDLLKALYP